MLEFCRRPFRYYLSHSRGSVSSQRRYYVVVGFDSFCIAAMIDRSIRRSSPGYFNPHAFIWRARHIPHPSVHPSP